MGEGSIPVPEEDSAPLLGKFERTLWHTVAPYLWQTAWQRKMTTL